MTSRLRTLLDTLKALAKMLLVLTAFVAYFAVLVAAPHVLHVTGTTVAVAYVALVAMSIGVTTWWFERKRKQRENIVPRHHQEFDHPS